MSFKRAMVILGLLSAGGYAFAEDAAVPECQKAELWVEAHMDSLPATLEALAPFTPTWRARIFDALPDETKAAIWHERLNQAYSRPLTPDQKALVDEVNATIAPELYRTKQIPASWRPRIAAAFQPDEAFDIFESLGPAVGGERQAMCDCNDDSDCHPAKPHCTSTPCTLKPTGCGIGHVSDCSFKCNL
jgi:hypothetical protein